MGELVASLRVEDPWLLINADGIRNGNGGRKRKPATDRVNARWQDKVTQLPRFKISSVLLSHGGISVVDATGEMDAEVALDRLNLRAENITNSTTLAPTLMATLKADARLLSSGTCELKAQGYPLAKMPTFNADLSSSGIELSSLRTVLQKITGIDVRHGTAALNASPPAREPTVRPKPSYTLRIAQADAYTILSSPRFSSEIDTTTLKSSKVDEGR